MPKYDLQIKNATIVTENTIFKGNIVVKSGKIVGIYKDSSHDSYETIDAEGYYLLPGMIDEHVHFMEPCENEREDWIHGTASAAVAGVTTVVEHTHRCPVRSVEEFEKKKEYVKGRSYIDFGLAAHVWPGYYKEIPKLWERGVSFFKIFTLNLHDVPGHNNYMLFKVLSLIASVNGLSLIHAEDESIIRGMQEELRTEGANILQRWRNKVAEEVAVSNVIKIAEITRAKVTIAHTSHPKVVQMVHEARSRGVDVWVESCPQYLFLDENILAQDERLFKFTPPARSKEEAQNMVELLQQEKIDIVASDHAPATKEMKTRGDIWTGIFGIPGIQTTLPLLLKLVSENKLSLTTIVKVYSRNPAIRLGLYPKKGTIMIGSDADFVIIDPEKKWTITDEWIISKARWTPYAGFSVTGKPIMTIVRGKKVVENDKIAIEPGWGEYIERNL